MAAHRHPLWNLIDGWPQFSDAVVDYDYRKKLAYAYVRRVQQPVLMMFGAPSAWKLPLYATNDTPGTVSLRGRVTCAASGDLLHVGEYTLQAGELRRVWEKDFSAGEKGLYLIDWQFGDTRGRNHYLVGSPAFDRKEYLSWMRGAKLADE
jgi:beta-mannosidase